MDHAVLCGHDQTFGFGPGMRGKAGPVLAHHVSQHFVQGVDRGHNTNLDGACGGEGAAPRRAEGNAKGAERLPGSSPNRWSGGEGNERDLSVCWVDYRKAFDLVPHVWIRKALRAIRAPRLVRRMVDILMPGWKTDIEVWTAGGKRRLPICLKRGLFQGDSLSPLLFCLCVSPLSHGLRERAGFRSVFQGSPVTHLMYMDDLKVYEESPEKLVDTVAVVEDVSTAIGMTLGLRKCAVAHMRRVRGAL